MHALVTGATGFLGSYLVAELCAAGHRVRALARNPHKSRLVEAMGAQVALGDLTDRASLATATRDIDVVFHAAALVTDWAPWSHFVRTTVQGTADLLQAAVVAGAGRFVLISTVRVYDDRACHRCRVVTEETPLGSRGFRAFGNYAAAKVLAEHCLWRCHAAGDIAATVLRPAWIYGPRDETILPHVVRFLRSRGAAWPSRGNPCVDPIHASDVARCAVLAGLNDQAIGQAYNVAPASEIRLREFLSPLCQELGIPVPRHALPYALTASVTRLAEWWARLTFRRRPPAFTRAGLAILTEDVHHDSAKARREFGWQPQISLAEGLRQTADWLRQRFPELGQAANDGTPPRSG
jgi:nucleoside-diphosphate-sugar epimerase